MNELSSEEKVLALQESAGNAAVATAIQRFSAGDLLEKGKELVFGEEKTNVEITAEEMNEQLESVIDKLEKASKVGEVAGADQFTEGCEGVAKGLKGVSGPIKKALEARETAREIGKLYRAVKKLNSIDLNKDYEEGADAMSDLMESSGRLGKKLLPSEEFPSGIIEAYLTMIEKSGAIFKMGARLRKDKEAQLDPDKYYEMMEKRLKETPPPPKPTAAQTTLDQLPEFVKGSIATATTEAQATQNWGWAGWGIYERDFLAAYDEFMTHYKKQHDLPLYERLGMEYRKEKIYEREPWEKAYHALQDMEQWIGRDPSLSVSFQPALKVWGSAKP